MLDEIEKKMNVLRKDFDKTKLNVEIGLSQA